MSNDNGKSFGDLRNIANIDDIVTVKGYAGREFQVTGYTHELLYQPEIVEESIIYDVIDTQTNEYTLAFQEDIAVVCGADKADEYLRGKIRIKPIDWAMLVGKVKGAEEMTPSEKPNRPIPKRELTKQERIDRLLMEISDYNDLIRNFGDDNGEYAAKIRTAEIRIEELTEHDRRRAGLE